jgi:hypothetical protein
MTVQPMLDAAQEMQFAAAAQDLIAQYGGDAVGVVKALMIYNRYLEEQIEEIAAAVPGLINVSHDGAMVETRRPL